MQVMKEQGKIRRISKIKILLQKDMNSNKNSWT